MHNELKFCKGSAEDNWNEAHRVKDIANGNRTSRQAGYLIVPISDLNVVMGNFKVCCLPRSAGLSETPGTPGRPGKFGAPRISGIPARSPQ
ncbi:hypothetical protein RB195_003785 [Necator americanus]|uniref:Uncharacterized protein n=1 Tax=Necator americanus TaxID=51031 RepID=A0ABR1DQ82_NECAM